MPYLGIFGLEFEKNYCHIWNRHPRICLIALNLGPKMPCLGIFGLEFEKSIVIFQISVLEFVLLQSLVQKSSSLNLGPKMRVRVLLGWNLKIILSYLKSAPWNLSDCKISWKKTKMLKLGTKNALFGYFWTGIWKKHCHISNQRPWICLVAKFSAKIIIFKFGTKNARSGTFGVEFENNLIILEISTLEFVWLQNFVKKKQKCLN